MFLVYGTNSIRIKKYTDHGHCCKSCRCFDMGIEVRQRYFHVLFIPCFPLNGKNANIRCNNCGEPLRNADILQEFEKNTRTPFYMFSGVMLVAALIIAIVIVNLKSQDEKAELVAMPRAGDTYLIRKSENNNTTYYFYS